MPLPSSGQITLDEMHVEAGGSTATEGAVNDADIRSLIGAASGGPNLAFTDWYGASGAVTINITISSNTNNYNLWNSKGGTYSAGNTTVNVTINSGVTIGSTSTSTYAFDTGTGWSSGDVINITNNGTIKGRGGDGGNGGDASWGQYANNGANGNTGGPAFRGQFACTVTNNGSVYGGGGGGGGSSGIWIDDQGKLNIDSVGSGGGGGGGAGVNGGGGGTAGTAYIGTGINPLIGQANNGVSGTATAGGVGGNNIIYSLQLGGAGGGLGSNGSNATAQTVGTNPGQVGSAGSGGTRGYYQVGSSLINGGSGISGIVGGRSA